MRNQVIFYGHGTYAYIASMGDLVAIVHNAIYRISHGVIKRPDLCCNGRIERTQKFIYFIDLRVLEPGKLAIHVVQNSGISAVARVL